MNYFSPVELLPWEKGKDSKRNRGLSKRKSKMNLKPTKELDVILFLGDDQKDWGNQVSKNRELIDAKSVDLN